MERELFSAVRSAASKVQAEKRAGKYQEALEVIAGLRKAVDDFFEERHGDGGEGGCAKKSPGIALGNPAGVHDDRGFLGIGWGGTQVGEIKFCFKF